MSRVSILGVSRLWLEPVQGSGFASDSLRVITQIRREAPRVQVLLFSATFDEQVRSSCSGASYVGHNLNSCLTSWLRSLCRAAAAKTWATCVCCSPTVQQEYWSSTTFTREQ